MMKKNIPSLSPWLIATRKSSILWKAMTLLPHQLQSKSPPVIKHSNPSNKQIQSPPPQPPHPVAQETSTAITNTARHGKGMTSLAHRESPMNKYPSHHSPPPFPSTTTMNQQHPTTSPFLTATPLPSHHPSIEFPLPLIPTPQTTSLPPFIPSTTKLQLPLPTSSLTSLLESLV